MFAFNQACCRPVVRFDNEVGRKQASEIVELENVQLSSSISQISSVRMPQLTHSTLGCVALTVIVNHEMGATGVRLSGLWASHLEDEEWTVRGTELKGFAEWKFRKN